MHLCRGRTYKDYASSRIAVKLIQHFFPEATDSYLMSLHLTYGGPSADGWAGFADYVCSHYSGRAYSSVRDRMEERGFSIRAEPLETTTITEEAP